MLPDIYGLCTRLATHRERCQSLFIDGFTKAAQAQGLVPAPPQQMNPLLPTGAPANPQLQQVLTPPNVQPPVNMPKAAQTSQPPIAETLAALKGEEEDSTFLPPDQYKSKLSATSLEPLKKRAYVEGFVEKLAQTEPLLDLPEIPVGSSAGWGSVLGGVPAAGYGALVGAPMGLLGGYMSADDEDGIGHYLKWMLGGSAAGAGISGAYGAGAGALLGSGLAKGVNALSQSAEGVVNDPHTRQAIENLRELGTTINDKGLMELLFGKQGPLGFLQEQALSSNTNVRDEAVEDAYFRSQNIQRKGTLPGGGTYTLSRAR